MRYIILSLLLLIPFFHHSLKAEEHSSSFYVFVAAALTAGLVDSIYKLVHEQKTKNELLAESLKNQRPITGSYDAIAYLKMLQETTRIHVQATNKLIAQFKDNPDQQKKFDGIVDKAAELHQEISNTLACAQQFTADDFNILIVLKARGFKDIPDSLIDEIMHKDSNIDGMRIAVGGNPHFQVKVSAGLLETLQQQSVASKAA